MKTVGTVCEFNPLHRGHVILIENIIRMCGEDSAKVCLMSGNFVQRGEPAVFDKYSRAKAAILVGFDLVLELPAPWSFSPAEQFAECAAGVLDRLGCVDSMVFGSESGDICDILGYAERATGFAMDSIPKTTSHQKASEQIFRERYGSGAFYPKKPNDILACEYVSALGKIGSNIVPMTYERRGGGSASAAREAIKRGDYGFLPAQASGLFDRALKPSSDRYDAALLHSLRLNPRFPDFVPGLVGGAGNRLTSMLGSVCTVEELIRKAVCGRYSAARLRRGMLCAALDVTSSDLKTTPVAIQLLAASLKGRELLSSVKKTAGIDVITRQSDLTGVPERADEFYSLICGIPYSEMIKMKPFIAT